MPMVHPSAILEGEVNLADNVIIGPHCVLDGKSGAITIGSGTRFIGNVWLAGPLTMGEQNTVYPFACIGFSPQDVKWDPKKPGAGVVIGNRNIIRESVTIHRATSDDIPTRIGDDNYWMACSHAGHDVIVENHCTIVNAALLGGHVHVADRVIIGGATTVHQFTRLGRGSMLSGAVGITQDLPPFFMLTGLNVAGSINVIGMRRAKMTSEEIDDVRWVYRVLYRKGLSLKRAMTILCEREFRPLVQEYIDFIGSSRRGICHGHGKAARGSASTSVSVEVQEQ